MKRKSAWILTIALLAVCGQTAAQTEAEVPAVDLSTAAAEGNLQAIKQHLEAGSDVNAKDPTYGGTPLMGTALFNRSEAAKLLIEYGADVNATNYEGSTALHTASFFCGIETVKLLLESGADVNLQNNRGDTALDIVSVEWSGDLEGIYNYFGGILGIQVDIERIKTARPEVAAILREHGGKTAAELGS